MDLVRSTRAYESTLSNKKHSIWVLEKNSSCFGVITLPEFLNHQLIRRHVKKAGAPMFFKERCPENSHTISGRKSTTFLKKHFITSVFRMIL